MKKNFCQITFTVFLASILHLSASAQVLPKKGAPPQRIYGLTIENLPDLDVDAFQRVLDTSVTITLRIVFQPKTLPTDYEAKLKTLHDLTKNGTRRFYLMGLLFDSQALKEYKLGSANDPMINCERLKPKDIENNDVMNYNQRAKCFIDHFKDDKDYIDAWEVGNEVNGEWADESYDNRTKQLELFAGDYEITLTKIDVAIDLVPNSKPLVLTLTYQPNCGEWKHNAMGQWIKHFRQTTIDKIDYVLISYYEDKCHYKVLDEREIDAMVIKPLREVFKNQFIGIGEIGYSAGEGENSKECPNNKNCYCSIQKTYCDETTSTRGTGPKLICRKSKISQMQRYYGMKWKDPLYVGGGFWWNADKDYKVPDFVSALKKQFQCFSDKSQCMPTPIDCP